MLLSECTSSYAYEGNWSRSCSIRKVMWFLNLPEAPHATAVSDIKKKIVDVASQSMISAANVIEGTRDENGICDITVSCDRK